MPPAPPHHSKLRPQLMSRRWLIWSVLVAAALSAERDAPAAQRAASSTSRFQAQHDEYIREFEEGRQQLIADCQAKGLSEAATEIAVWQIPHDLSALTGMSLPSEVQPEIPLSLPNAERQWRIQFRNLKQEVAKELYLLSRRVLNADLPNAAWRLIHEVVWFDPDYERARTILGYERYGDEWVTPFAAKKLRERFVWHEQFGWLPAAHIDRYENGERIYRTRWYTAQKEAELRRDFAHAWEVETDNFLIKTNVSLETGVKLAKKLEVFHDWFTRSFPAFFNTPDQLKKLFAGAARRRRAVRKQFVIHFYRTRDEYVNRLIKDNPQIEITNGIYMPDERTAHFYPDPNSDIESTIYHETTHQILYEIDPKPRAIADREHFWVIEGFACYMESFRPQEDGVSIGNPDYTRFYWARQRLVEENFFVPLDRFAALGKVTYQNQLQIRERYSQASGLVHFYMHSNQGRYRDAFIDHIAALYRPLPKGFRVGGMDRYTGVSYEALGQQYRDYISGLESNPLAAAD